MEYIQFIAFFLEYIKDNMLLPGRVENWVLITDMGHQGLGPSSLSKLKEVMKVLTDNYRCRLGVNYILNPPKTVYFIWSCIKPFMDEVLIEKMKIINNSFSPELLTHCNPYQIEVRYGGKAPNLEVHWPPYVPDAPFHLESSMSFREKSSRNIIININRVEPSEISLADTKLTQSMKMFGDIASEKQVESFIEKEVSEKSMIIIEENINETNEMQSESRNIEKIAKKEAKKQRRIERKLRRRKRELESSQVKEEEKEPEVQAIIVQVEEIPYEDFEKLEAENKPTELNEIQGEIQFESTKKEAMCSICSSLHSKCLIF